MSFRSYASYKVQNFSARIPSHWDTKPFRFLTRCRKGRLPGNGASAYLSSGAIPYLSMEYLRGSSEPAMFIEPGPRELVAEANDILLLWDGSNAGEFLRAKRGVVSSTVSLVEPIGVERDFLFFACKAEEAQLKHLSVGMGIPHVSSAELGNIAIFLPPSAEQVCIASFLDQETSKIDALISEQQRLIELLKEKRQAVISHAVTKGLNPDVRMKPSGVEWLGGVPEHWRVLSLKHICDVRDGTHDTPDYVEPDESTFPLVTSKDLTEGMVSFAEAKHIRKEDYTEIARRSEVCNGDILMPMIGSIGGAVLVDTQGKFAIKNVALFKKAADYSGVWLRYVLNSDLCHMQFELSRSGGVQNFVGLSTLRNLTIPCPPLQEQKLLANAIECATQKLDGLLVQAVSAINLLSERRTALISAAVTGKIDVRNYAATQKDAA